MPQELEITIENGTIKVEVVSSTKDCKKVIQPFIKMAGGGVYIRKPLPNPGLKKKERGKA